MSMISEVQITPKSADSFVSILGRETVESVRGLAADLQQKLNGRVIWNVNSTAAGGGVAEMLHTLLAYAKGMEVNTRWLVVSGRPDYFRITKRLHNALHGELGDGSPLDAEAAAIYDKVIAENASELLNLVRRDDVVILHDPQTAGLIPYLVKHGVGVFWRCHIGNDNQGPQDALAWKFLQPYLKEATGFIYSRFSYLPEFIYHGRCLIVPPSIDPFSAKNQHMTASSIRAIMVHLGLVSGNAGSGSRTFTLGDGSRSRIERRAEIIREGSAPAWDTPLVVQVSRWDRLKDPIGVMHGFIKSIESSSNNSDLLLVGPSVAAVSDDPEGAEVCDEVTAEWRKLPEAIRSRVQLVNLPMDDLQENAAMVNAIQRHAAMVIQKSLREGFGLTVTEAMWKARPVIASAVGGIQDQIEHGVSGLLLKDPTDMSAFAGAINQVLTNPGFAKRLGRNARNRVALNYLGLSIISQFDDLVERLENTVQESAA
jgi:trehalose synthase